MNKMVMIVVVLLVLGGTVIGLGMTGIVEIPGLSPKKKKKAVPTVEEVKTEAKAPTPKMPKPAPKAKPGDPAKGYEAVAQIWNEMDINTLLPMTEKWRDDELAPILAKMDGGKVVELLSQMKTERAALLTRALQRIAEGS